VRRLARLQARLLVVGLCVGIAGAVTTAGGAGTPGTLRQRADALRRQDATAAERARETELSLYSLDAQLAQANARLASLRARRARIAGERQSVRVRLGVARHDMRASQRRLALLVHALYEQQATDPLAVVLGAASLDEAITTLDDLSSAARQHRAVAAQSRDAQRKLVGLQRRLARKDAQVQALEAAAGSTASSLAAAASARRRYLASLAATRTLDAARIAGLDARARASAARSVAMTPAATTASATAAPVTVGAAAAAPGGRALSVVATGYSGGDTTATGVPVAWGVVAVDPALIPLGTRMTIPGYGTGVAADTGSAIRGATIDLWFPTQAQALGWGRRVVTVTLQ
jgi:3D (Asp-Asp-Asp) domain-containing protein